MKTLKLHLPTNRILQSATAPQIYARCTQYVYRQQIDETKFLEAPTAARCQKCNTMLPEVAR